MLQLHVEKYGEKSKIQQNKKRIKYNLELMSFTGELCNSPVIALLKGELREMSSLADR